MTIMRIIGRLVLQKSSQPSSLRRCLSTAEQPRSRNTLFYKVVGSKGSIPDAMNEWIAAGRKVTKSDIINISTYYRTRQNFQQALQVYEWMDSSNLQISTADQAIRIDLLGRTKGSAAAEKYFDSLPEKDSKTYGALLNCYCRERVLDKALETFQKIKESNQTNTLAFNNVISLYYNLNKHEKVVSLVEEMEKSIAPDIYTYNMLINTHAALKNFDALEGVLEKMERSNVKPDLFTYSNLATIYSNEGLHDKASAYLELMEKMETKKKKTATEACRTRIRLYSMMNDLPGVNRAWEALKSDEPKVSNTSYLFMLLAMAKMGNQKNLEKILKEWEDGCTLSFYDYRLPNVVLEYYISRDMIEEANLLYKRLVDGLTDRGSAPNLKTLELFATLCLKNSQIDLALEYLEKGLEKANTRNSNWFPRSDTIEKFVSYLEEKDDTERGLKFIETMKKHDRLHSESLLTYIKATEAGG